MRLHLNRLFTVLGLLLPLAALATSTVTGLGGVGNKIAIQADGKPLVAGYALSGSGLNRILSVALLRYNSDGSLDATFGNGGVVLSHGGPGNSLALQLDGKIVLAGGSGLLRYNSDGSTDSTFGSSGVVTASAGPGNNIALQGDGKIVVAGSTGLLRYNSDGSADLSFGAGAAVATGGAAYSVMVQTDGKLVVAGDAGVLRFNTDGSADLGFGTNGKVTTAIGINASDASSIMMQAHDLAPQSGGRILVSGYALAGRSTYDTAFVRYNSNGSLDTSFGNAGVLISSGAVPVAAYRLVNDVAAQLDGKFLAAAGIAPLRLGSLPGPGSLSRYNADGSVDAGFGTAGVTANNALTGQGVAVLADGRILVTGSIDNGSSTVIALMRYSSNGVLDGSFGVVGVGTSVPGTPTVSTALAGNAQATISFTPPVDNGGSAITHYAVTANPGGNTEIGQTSPITVTGLNNGVSYTFTVNAANGVGFGAASSASAAATPQSAVLAPNLNLVAGWNLLGNGLEAPISVSATFGDATKVTAIWKWMTSGAQAGVTYPNWAFHDPAQADGGQAFAAAQGYDYLSTINAGEGFWVNAKTAFTKPLLPGTAVQSSSFKPAAIAVAGGTHALSHGWSLIATGDTPSPSQFNSAIASLLSAPPSPGQIAGLALNLTSLWAWDAAKQSWYFWAPSLVNSNELAGYLSSNKLLDFATLPTAPAGSVAPTTGIWVNLP